MDDVEELAAETDKRLSVHEAVCANRYESIYKSLDSAYKRANRIEYLLYIVIASVLLGPGAAAEFFKKFIGL